MTLPLDGIEQDCPLGLGLCRFETGAVVDEKPGVRVQVHPASIVGRSTVLIVTRLDHAFPRAGQQFVPLLDRFEDHLHRLRVSPLPAQ